MSPQTLPLPPRVTDDTPTAPEIRVHGFTVACIQCGEKEVTVAPADVTRFCCEGCGYDFGPEDVQQHMAGWASVLAWVESAPIRTV
jgi:hypothetical protein